MLALVILALYGILVLLYIITCFFIAYHLLNFSIDSILKTVMLVVFILLSVALLVSNALLFFSVDWNYLTSNLIS